jgi:hypothetical protein
MIKFLLFTLTLLTISFSCENLQKKHFISRSVKLSAINDDSISGEINCITKEIICDTIYKNKGYKISLTILKSLDNDDSFVNSLFTLSKKINEKYLTFYSDSIFTTLGEIRFEDFNNDNIKDILIQNISDVRSNWTYNLYLIDTSKNIVRKVKGFNEIKNPRYLPKYDLIDNEVMSGRDWTAFYKIIKDSIQSFEEEQYIVYWGQDENGEPKNPHKIYKQNLKKVLNRIKN